MSDQTSVMKETDVVHVKASRAISHSGVVDEIQLGDGHSLGDAAGGASRLQVIDRPDKVLLPRHHRGNCGGDSLKIDAVGGGIREQQYLVVTAYAHEGGINVDVHGDAVGSVEIGRNETAQVENVRVIAAGSGDLNPHQSRTFREGSCRIAGSHEAACRVGSFPSPVLRQAVESVEQRRAWRGRRGGQTTGLDQADVVHIKTACGYCASCVQDEIKVGK
jgi:hypothetical protein